MRLFRAIGIFSLALALAGIEDFAAAAPAKTTGSAAPSRGKTKTVKRAPAKGKRRAVRKPARRRTAAKGRRVCRGTGRRRTCRYVSYFSGHGVAKETLRKEPLPRPSGDFWLYAVNFHEELKANIYRADGSFDDAVLAQLDHGFRCKRTGEERAVDPRLFEVLSMVYDHFGQRRIELISGFRFQRNEGSRHFHASAMDIRIEGVTIRELYDYAESLDTGGMGIGIYPVSDFVHIDFRAPGEPSYRWVDRNPNDDDPGKRPSKQWTGRPKKPTS